MRAEASHAPDQVVQYLDGALDLLRFYEADGLPPHDTYPTYRQNISKPNSSWVAGSPNPAKIAGVRDRASKYAVSWGSISSQSDAMRELRQELATESNVDYADWFRWRLGLSLPEWAQWLGVVLGFLIFPLPLVLMAWVIWQWSEGLRLRHWTRLRLERWNHWVLNQGTRP